MATADYARKVDRMFPDDWKALCVRMHLLAEKVNDYGQDVQLVGIYLDGLPIARGVGYALEKRFKRHVPIDTILISSKLGLADNPKMEQLRASGKKRIYVDRRTKTGSLGRKLKELDPYAIYAVLEDPSGKADIGIGGTEVPWFSWPGRIWGPKVMADSTAPFIGVKVAPALDGKGFLYNPAKGEATDVFYKKLYERMDRTEPKEH